MGNSVLYCKQGAMKPTREQIELCVLQMMQEDIYKTKLEDVIWLLSPDVYKPIITVFDCLYPLRVIYPEIHDCISYWWYDCDCFTDKIGKVQNKDWEVLEMQARSLESLKKYLILENVVTSEE